MRRREGITRLAMALACITAAAGLGGCHAAGGPKVGVAGATAAGAAADGLIGAATGAAIVPGMILGAGVNSPFWLDPGDPHRMAAAMQFLAQPRDYWEAYPAFSGEWRHDNVFRDRVWPTAVHRIVAQGFSPEQAVDEAITRVHQILSE